MARSEAAVFTNMCMVYNEQGQILVQDRKNKIGRESRFLAGMSKKENRSSAL